MAAIVTTVTVGTDTHSVYALHAGQAVADADSFWNLRLGDAADAWNAASADDKARALVLAVDWLDRATEWQGDEQVAGQPLDWPRINVVNQCTGEAETDGVIPDEIAWAEFWLAGNILNDDSIVDASGQGSNVKSAAAGSAKVEFFSSTLDSGQDTRLPRTANDYIKCWMSGSSNIIAPTTSGDDEESYFDEDDYGRHWGFS